MSRLMKFLIAGLTVVVAWGLAVTQKFGKLEEDQLSKLLILPVYVVIAIGLFAASVVIYQALAIKNCNQAYGELREDITEARRELAKKGFSFD